MKSTIEIVPAVLEQTENELKKQFDRLAHLAPRMQMDYIDNDFARGDTVDWHILLDLPEIYHHLLLELHILARDPLPIALAGAQAGFATVIVPVEEMKETDIDMMKRIAESAELMLCINLETDIHALHPYRDVAYGVTVMTIIPGRQGNPFQPAGLAKVDALRALGYRGILEIDGSVNETTIEAIITHDVNRLVVGSALTRVSQPDEVYKKLLGKISEVSLL